MRSRTASGGKILPVLPAFIAASFCWFTPINAAPALERPAAIVTAGTARRMAAGSSSEHTVESGAALFSGDVLMRTEGLTVAFCGPNAASGVLLQLSDNGEYTITAQGPAAKGGSSIFISTIAVCEYPRIDRAPRARNSSPPNVTGRTGAIESRLAARSVSAARQYQEAVAMGADARLTLVSKIVRAAILERAGLPADARDLYCLLRDDRNAPGATWTRDAITRIDYGIAEESAPADLSSRTVPSGAPGVRHKYPKFNEGTTYALLVGISKFPAGTGPPLHYAHQDAVAFQKFLTARRGGAVPPGNIRLLTDENATLDNFNESLDELVKMGAGSQRDVEKKNTFVLFIASHGTYSCSGKKEDLLAGIKFKTEDRRSEQGRSMDEEDPSKPQAGCPAGQQPFVVMHDGEREAPNITGVSMESIRQRVVSRAADFGRVLVFIDVCHGGNVIWDVDRLSVKDSEVVRALKEQNGAVGILAGSRVTNSHRREEEYTYESRALRHGVFTYYLLNGLNGALTPAQGIIEIEDVRNYVAGEVRRFTNKRSSPAAWFTFADLPMIGLPDEEPAPLDLPAVDTAGDVDPRDLVLRDLGFDDAGFRDALQSGSIEGPDSRAAAAVRAAARRYGEDSPIYRMLKNRYRVSLEDSGQKILVRYLHGDQEYMGPKEFERCADDFEQALALEPDAAFDESRALFCRGRALAMGPDFDRARYLLEKSIQIDPNRSYSYNALGIAFLEHTKTDAEYLQRAIAAFQDAIRFETKWAYPRHNLALALAEAGRYGDAVTAYRHAMAIGPQYSYLPYNLGLLYQQVKNYDEARSAYRLAIQIAGKRCKSRSIDDNDPCPERALPRAALGAVYAQQGKRRKSELTYLDARSDAPKDLLISHNLAALYSGWKGREKDAEGIWTAILKDHPRHIPSLVGYTGLLKQECRFRDALAPLASLVDAAPDYEPAKLDLALALTHAGKAQDAAAMLAKTKTHSAEYWAVLAQTKQAMGDPNGASQAWQAALAQLSDSDERKQMQHRRNMNGQCAAMASKAQSHQ